MIDPFIKRWKKNFRQSLLRHYIQFSFILLNSTISNKQVNIHIKLTKICTHQDVSFQSHWKVGKMICGFLKKENFSGKQTLWFLLWISERPTGSFLFWSFSAGMDLMTLHVDEFWSYLQGKHTNQRLKGFCSCEVCESPRHLKASLTVARSLGSARAQWGRARRDP